MVDDFEETKLLAGLDDGCCRARLPKVDDGEAGEVSARFRRPHKGYLVYRIGYDHHGLEKRKQNRGVLEMELVVGRGEERRALKVMHDKRVSWAIYVY